MCCTRYKMSLPSVTSDGQSAKKMQADDSPAVQQLLAQLCDVLSVVGPDRAFAATENNRLPAQSTEAIVAHSEYLGGGTDGHVISIPYVYAKPAFSMPDDALEDAEPVVLKIVDVNRLATNLSCGVDNPAVREVVLGLSIELSRRTVTQDSKLLRALQYVANGTVYRVWEGNELSGTANLRATQLQLQFLQMLLQRYTASAPVEDRPTLDRNMSNLPANERIQHIKQLRDYFNKHRPTAIWPSPLDSIGATAITLLPDNARAILYVRQMLLRPRYSKQAIEQLRALPTRTDEQQKTLSSYERLKQMEQAAQRGLAPAQEQRYLQLYLNYYAAKKLAVSPPPRPLGPVIVLRQRKLKGPSMTAYLLALLKEYTVLQRPNIERQIILILSVLRTMLGRLVTQGFYHRDFSWDNVMLDAVVDRTTLDGTGAYGSIELYDDAGGVWLIRENDWPVINNDGQAFVPVFIDLARSVFVTNYGNNCHNLSSVYQRWTYGGATARTIDLRRMALQTAFIISYALKLGARIPPKMWEFVIAGVTLPQSQLQLLVNPLHRALQIPEGLYEFHQVTEGATLMDYVNDCRVLIEWAINRNSRHADIIDEVLRRLNINQGPFTLLLNTLQSDSGSMADPANRQRWQCLTVSDSKRRLSEMRL